MKPILRKVLVGPVTKLERFEWTISMNLKNWEFQLLNRNFWKFTNPSIIKNSEFTLGLSKDYDDKKYDIILVNGKLTKKNDDIKINNIHESLAEKKISNEIFGITNNPFINLNNAFSTEGCVLSFKDNVEKEISILNVIDNTTSKQITHPRIIINVGKNSNISILEKIRFF